MGACLIDDAVLAAVLGAVLAANVAAKERGRPSPLALPRPVRLWVPICVTVPAAVALAAMEHRRGTVGKGAVGLRLKQWPAASRTPLPWSRALTRSLLKTGLPWELGHQSVWQLRAHKKVSGSLLAAAAYALLIAQLVGAAQPDGRTYADILSGSLVNTR